MWSDNHTDKDFLNFKCVADTAAELIIKANGHPLSLGVSGGWGVGKSSMLSLIAKSLEAKSESGQAKYIFIDFNAWLYQGYDDARAALMDVIVRRLISHSDQSAGVIEKSKGLLRRVKWLRFAALTAGAAASLALGIPPLGLVGSVWSSSKNLLDGDISEEDVRTACETGKMVAAESTNLFQPKSDTSPPKEIQDLRVHLQETLSEMGVTLVVFIDDLDRCLPSTSIATLEAIRLFLFLKNTAFIIAADDRMIRQAVRFHFKGAELNDDLVTNYFDKLIQVPLRVPPLGTQDVRAYLMLLYVENSSIPYELKEEVRLAVCKQLAESWKGGRVDAAFMKKSISNCPEDLKINLELADRLAPLMASSSQIAGNPRLIKRFLNTLAIRLSIAKAQGVSLDEGALAKMILFERCAAEEAHAELIKRINESDTGKPVFLAESERKISLGEDVEKLPLSGDSDFIREWLALDPPLADMDMRAIIYVSREHMPIITPSDRLSSIAAEAMEALLGLTRNCPEPMLSTLRELPRRELSLILDRLLVRARQEASWGTPNVFFAMLAIAKADESHEKTVGDFLIQIPTEKLQPDIIPALNDLNWAHAALISWQKGSSTSSVVKKAIKQFLKKE